MPDAAIGGGTSAENRVLYAGSLASSTLAAGANAGATSVRVVDSAGFDTHLMFGAGNAGYHITAVDSDTHEITLATALGARLSSGAACIAAPLIGAGARLDLAAADYREIRVDGLFAFFNKTTMAKTLHVGHSTGYFIGGDGRTQSSWYRADDETASWLAGENMEAAGIQSMAVGVLFERYNRLARNFLTIEYDLARHQIFLLDNTSPSNLTYLPVVSSLVVSGH